MLALRRDQLDLAAGTLRLDPGQTKNDDGRLVYLTPELKILLRTQVRRVESLEERLKRRPVAWLFPHLGLRGRHISPRLVGTRIKDHRRAWVSACVAAGLGTVDPVSQVNRTERKRHDFRRTAVRNLVEHAGVSERVAMTTGQKTRSVFGDSGVNGVV